MFTLKSWCTCKFHAFVLLIFLKISLQLKKSMCEGLGFCFLIHVNRATSWQFLFYSKGDFIALFINKTFHVDTPCHGAMYNIACVSRHCDITSWFYNLVKMTHSGNPNLKAIIGFFQHSHFTFTKTNLDLSYILTRYTCMP